MKTENTKKKKLVLAYSGGLDTSYCAMYLSKELGYEVHAVSVNTGGFSEDELEDIKKRALELGAHSYNAIDAVQSFYEKVVKYLIFGNVLRNNTYPLSVSAERIVQAMEISAYARKIGAHAIAHGSTGAGNDQVRFDMIFQIASPEIEIITPIRDQQLSREEEITYLRENGVDYSWEKAKYSINKGLWGTSVGGAETLTSGKGLPDEAFPSPLKKEKPEDVTLTFDRGELKAINGQAGDPVDNIRKLEAMASAYAIGRDIHVGDTIIGIKGRVGFEAAAPLIILKAHHLLEKHTLSKWQQFQKEQLGNFYGMLLHEGNYLDEVMRNIEAFLKDTQRHVSGEVFVTLHPYRFTLNGIRSDFDLMAAKFGSYGEMNRAWTAEDAKGFIKILSNPGKIANQINTTHD
ncbi:argininosuccinate synthase [Muriicola jejuensis]|uniref:argininosuccinate synthase n=1 Tax=Muriicola jejuensis TaxID=504488 RepID=A0A6P0UAX1_9FLAO|nr:argininosuccinate synthase domain-containing protein [Muriicola jejuensis]NER10365.1 argininosuccinate synthase [Muriicola jejuensis]SMP01076.1 argininosuccinate synthase [Muriicola jejuensis]